jgi:hypothetical protein
VYGLLLREIAFGIAGAIGGALLLASGGRLPFHKPSPNAKAAPHGGLGVLGFAIGFIVLYLLASYPGSMLIEQKIIEDPYRVSLWFLLCLGVGFALAGGIGAGIMGLSWRTAWAGAISFGIGGLVGGALCAGIILSFPDREFVGLRWLLCWLAFVLGLGLAGTLFGAKLNSWAKAEAAAVTSLSPALAHPR